MKQVMVLEPSLVENAGHHHTQIAALSSLLPQADFCVLAGSSYSGFLGLDFTKLDEEAIRTRKLQMRVRFEQGLKSKVSAIRLLPRRVRGLLQASAYGSSLIEYCQQKRISRNDAVIVPSADLDSLESVAELVVALGDCCPRTCLRFLTPDLGVHRDDVRVARIRSISQSVLDRMYLFTETDELARYLQRTYGLAATGGFYLPCSITEQINPKARSSDFLRVGVFGAPKRRKGSDRIKSIVDKAGELLKFGADVKLDFVIQGSDSDFAPGGVYSALDSIGGINIRVTRQSDKLSPKQFQQLFCSVDSVLLPYDVSSYGLQGSGVVQDAVNALKPIICSAGMSMKDLLSHGNARLVDNDENFAKAIIEIAANMPAFNDGAIQAASHYKRHMEAHPLLAVL